MPFTYDIKNDIRYKQGGESKATLGVKNMLEEGFSHSMISKLLEVSIDFIKEVEKSMKK